MAHYTNVATYSTPKSLVRSLWDDYLQLSLGMANISFSDGQVGVCKGTGGVGPRAV